MIEAKYRSTQLLTRNFRNTVPNSCAREEMLSLMTLSRLSLMTNFTIPEMHNHLFLISGMKARS